MKKSLVAALAVCSALALAAVLTIGATGQGAATTADGRRATFSFEATKRTDGTAAPQYFVRLRLLQPAKETQPYALVEATTVTGLGVTTDGHVCEFSGRGRLTRMVDGKPFVSGGALSVRAADRRAPGKPGEPDQFRVRFTPERGAAYAFEGTVVEGDVVVFRR